MAGIITSLNARTWDLACANPSGSRYNPRLSVIDYIQLPPTLLSSFDLIYLVLDKADEQTYRHLARHLVALHYDDEPEDLTLDALGLPTLASYITYTRQHIHSKISDEVAEDLIRGYVEMRRKDNFPGSSKKVITTTPRQIERLIRINESLAHIRFSEWVERIIIMEKMQAGGPSICITELLEEMHKQGSNEVNVNDIRNAIGNVVSEWFITIHRDNFKRT
ncbi:hypothetical protein SUGI_0252540 [Cryptomeria japonica]|nr:hypothetical protein SUGI_0252540 [Cryptomeria japonica]